MKCPNGCGFTVPSGRFFCCDKCRRQANEKGIHMPLRFEKKQRYTRRLQSDTKRILRKTA